ncbi:3,4-dihydroxy-2-butanone-4-phosphate synthase [Sphingobium phenoxybenzoativorans]|uniref:3,4-dihydroxy-2-butanone 4-phosphate synthase n=1 Tax=Sphingobium phenoxybenzoativorans TaxID=1592790 RepID=A0A975K8P6_9SPHN|nr:3,4-dihydroxy-2-butanone-4-phosphate synthase [Sphingobium phenoxybenzoativorans]QUT06854.1 3,4-dihydroxy-2-butanone-4-phosphate synthase [Sphingobium phenoxybenzoativorans]
MIFFTIESPGMTHTALKLLDGGLASSSADRAMGPPCPTWLSDTATVLRDIKNGRMCVLIDNQGPESGAILFVPAQMATPDAITFMACQGRGLICLALTPERVEALGLQRQSRYSRRDRDFTVSIEARTGVTTGISAFDRARTVAVAIGTADANNDLVSPGHVFPLVAQSGGVLSQRGYAEAVVDLSRLAGLNPSGVFCVILKADGGTARLCDLESLSKDHGLKVGSIDDLVGFRLQHDRNVVQVRSKLRVDGLGGHWDTRVYRHLVSGAEALALRKNGPCDAVTPLFIGYRTSYEGMMTSVGTDDMARSFMLGGLKRSGSVVILLDRKISEEESSSADYVAANSQNDESCHFLRHEICAQILTDLGITHVDLLEETLVNGPGFDKFRISVVKRVEH